MDMPTTTAATAGARVLASLHQGFDKHDPALLASLYHPDCEQVTISRNAPPSHPQVLHGREAVEAMYRDVFSRDMTHRIEREIASDDRVALQIGCRYADGTQVAAMVIAELEGGLIRRQTEIDCWDE